MLRVVAPLLWLPSVDISHQANEPDGLQCLVHLEHLGDRNNAHRSVAARTVAVEATEPVVVHAVSTGRSQVSAALFDELSLSSGISHTVVTNLTDVDYFFEALPLSLTKLLGSRPPEESVEDTLSPPQLFCILDSVVVLMRLTIIVHGTVFMRTTQSFFVDHILRDYEHFFRFTPLARDGMVALDAGGAFTPLIF